MKQQWWYPCFWARDLPQVDMQLWQIEALLKDLKAFENPNVYLEQYTTPPHIAAYLLHMAETSFGDLKGKQVADLGCGTGMLCAAMCHFEARYSSHPIVLLLGYIFLYSNIVGVDVDESALNVSNWHTIERLPTYGLIG